MGDLSTLAPEPARVQFKDGQASSSSHFFGKKIVNVPSCPRSKVYVVNHLFLEVDFKEQLEGR